MALQGSGQMKMSDIYDEFTGTHNGSQEIQMTDYRDKGDVPAGGTDEIQLATDMYGASNVTYMAATGGTTSTYTDGDSVGWKVHVFTGNGTFAVQTVGSGDYGKLETFIIGGGGGGAANDSNRKGPGGGAGGAESYWGTGSESGNPSDDGNQRGGAFTAATGNYTCVVGSGGTGAAANRYGGSGGYGSYIKNPSDSYITIVRGGGGAPQSQGNGSGGNGSATAFRGAGGSSSGSDMGVGGSGAGMYWTTEGRNGQNYGGSSMYNGGNTTVVYDDKDGGWGGNGVNTTNSGFRSGGGGGSDGGGSNGTWASTTYSGFGGKGVQTHIRTGSWTTDWNPPQNTTAGSYYGFGGGSSGNGKKYDSTQGYNESNAATKAASGNGPFRQLSPFNGSNYSISASPNTGDGANGYSYSTNYGSMTGGSGVVMIRYRTAQIWLKKNQFTLNQIQIIKLLI